jgi:3-oxoacyl-[acyl-carrier protein] reductase
MTNESTKLAVVTGGSGYVGSAVTEMLAARGYMVINLGRKDTVAPHMETVRCDLADTASSRAVAEQIVESRGAPDVIVHMACPPTTRRALEDTTTQEQNTEFAVSAGAAQILADVFLPHMRDNSVFIGITTASLEKEIPEKNIGAYIPAKQALRKLLADLQVSYPHVRIYAVAPPFMPGGLNKDLPEGVRTLLARQKDGSVPEAKDVAAVIEKLISADEHYPAGSSIELPRGEISPL